MLVASCLTFAFTFGLAWYDYQVKKKQQQKQQKKRNFQTIKILLTGGPCGGKSEGINCIYHSFISIAAPVFIVPQAATIIGTAGLTLDLSQFKPRQIQLFQIYLMRLQYNLEEIVISIATNLQKLQKTPVVLCDRGLLDGKAYAGEQNWAKMLKQIAITQSDILNRYKAAIHMVTAAKGAETYYNYTAEQKQNKDADSQEGNEGLKVRKESPQLAVDLDERIQRCYKKHPNRYIISNEFFVKTFEDKKTVLLAQVYQILSQIIKRNDLSQYYLDYESTRKYSEENMHMMEQYPSPYLVRKRKFQKFLRQSKSPVRSSERKARE